MIDRRSARDDHRRRRRWLGASLVVLATAAGHVARAAPVLPTGGVVRAGSASISSPGAGSLTVTQSSSRAIVDWGSFSIGSGATVRFDNGSGATLNRVTGGSVSSIDGLLSASGGVYLLDPNGVIVGRSGVVDVGGSFVASTLELSNSAFLKGGDLTFIGGSTAAVVNLGKVGALGGDIVMIASTVRNEGSITAANGDVGLLAGTQVLVRDQALDGGRFAVKLGAAGTSVTNTGAVAAAQAELRANGGDVYALAGDTAGVIRATGVAAQGGRVFLTAGDAGSVTLGGTITARGAGGAGGVIETSAGKVDIGAAKIDAGAGGSWLLDPNDLTIDQTAANTIASTLNAGTSVTQQTTASGTGGNGDIFVAPNVNLSWTTNAALTLSAYRDIDIGAAATLKSTGGGPVTLYADNTGTGVGAVNLGVGAKISTSGAVTLFYNPASNAAGGGINTTSYTHPADYSSFVAGGGTLTAYMLVNTLNDLQNVQNNLGGNYALGRDIDASATAGWNGGSGFAPIGASLSSAFTGVFEGQGYAISGLTIARFQDVVGLFGTIGHSGVIESVALNGVAVSGRFYVGGLIGDNYGTVSDARVSGAVSGAGGIGGLIGVSEGDTTVSHVSSSAAVTASQSDAGGLIGVDLATVFDASASGPVNGYYNVGGLIGFIAGPVSSSTASGAVTGVGDVGGLIGYEDGAYYGKLGSISNSYATGAVTGGSAGGLVGLSSGYVFSSYASGLVTNSAASGDPGGLAGEYIGNGSTTSFYYSNDYWDATTTGANKFFGSVLIGAGDHNVMAISGSSNLSPYAQSTYAGFDFSATGPWVIFEGQTRPILKSEASTTITNAHQLQLIDLNRAGSYVLATDLDLGVTGNPSDVWNPATQFVPIAAGPANTSPFVGSFDGQGHTISNLRVFVNYAGAGLFGVVGATGKINNLELTGVDVNGAYYVGSLIGDNFGTVSNVSISGNVMGYGGVGGLIGVGESGSMVTGAFGSGLKLGISYSMFVSGSADDVGGLLGVNLGVLASSTGGGSIYAGNQVGGAVGLNIGTIVASNASTPGGFFATSVSGLSGVGGLVGENAGSLSQSNSAATVSGSNRVGGLVGLNTGSIATSFATNDPAASAGTVGTTIYGQYANYAGGLIGFNAPGATVADSYATDSSSGSALIGRNYGTVTRAYATGAVGANGAGVASLNQGVLTEVVWDAGTTGTTIGVASDAGTSTSVLPIGGATGVDPTRAASYPGFDFTNVWSIVPGVSRPTLRHAPGQ